MRKKKKLPNNGNPDQEYSSNTQEDEKHFDLKKIFIFVLFVIIVYKLRDVIYGIYQSFVGTVSKDHFRKRYNVDAKTFNKWVEIFCSSEIDFEEYKKGRKLKNSTCHKIESILGIQSDDTPTMSKRDILNAADGSYDLLRQVIRKFPEYFNITPEVFKSLNYFPPKIAQRILIGYRDGIKSLVPIDHKIIELKNAITESLRSPY